MYLARITLLALVSSKRFWLSQIMPGWHDLGREWPRNADTEYFCTGSFIQPEGRSAKLPAATVHRYGQLATPHPYFEPARAIA